MFSLLDSKVNIDELARLLSQLDLLLTKHPIAIDARKLKPKSIFCAYPGVAHDGRDYMASAIANDVIMILWEAGYKFPFDLPNLEVKNLQHYVGVLAAHGLNHPSSKLNVVGITGTNGKTSISHWLAQAFSYLNQSIGLVGTTGVGVYPRITDFAGTTPDPITLQNLFDGFSLNKIDNVAIEVSSHALDQGRVNGVNFTTAVFSNLTQDHLDYHETMENYFAAKRQLFYWQGLINAVINADDHYGAILITELTQNRPELNIISYGIHHGSVRARSIEFSRSGTSFILEYNGRTQLINASVLGEFNVYNLLALIATLILNDINWDIMPSIIKQLTSVTGRMDIQNYPGKPLAIIDFAHTPDGLKQVLLALAQIKNSDGQLICVFGCGGERDKSKRPIMGKIATQLSDLVIVTSDNPRSENPDQIIEDITAQLTTNNYQIVSDRENAIKYALSIAKYHDIILIAGKGHETYQEIKGIKHEFSDIKLVRNLLNNDFKVRG